MGDYSKGMCNDSLRLAPGVAIWMVKADELGPLEAAVEVVAETVRRLLAAPSKKGHSLPRKRTVARKPESAKIQG